MSDQPYSTAVSITPSDSTTAYRPGRILAVNCTVAGNASVVMSSGNVVVMRMEVGQSFLPLAVSRVNSTGTTATATYTNIDY